MLSIPTLRSAGRPFSSFKLTQGLFTARTVFFPTFRMWTRMGPALCAAVQAWRAFSRRFARMATKSTSATSDCAGVSACAVNATPAAFAFSA